MAVLLFFTDTKNFHEDKKTNNTDLDLLGDTRKLFEKVIPDLKELSGIAVSKKNPGIFWVHNDGRSNGLIYALDKEGNIKDIIRISNMTDIEDIAIGKYNEKEYIFLGDVGDNDKNRTEYQICMIEEPVCQSGEIPIETVYKFVYSDGKSYDCESIAYNPCVSGGAIYLITKAKKPQVFKLELSSLKTTKINVAQNIGRLNIKDFKKPSAADISRDGLALVVRNEEQIFVLKTKTPGEFDSILEEEAISLNCPPEPNGEAIAIDPSNKKIYTASEEQPKVIYEISYDLESRIDWTTKTYD